ncbi:ATP-binding protein [[Clostridium] innocuum]|uniref:helicase HerA domain-containing protein n=2 Tax=Bacteria TaxID=2 RepID=UPI001E4D3FD8|nr:ATP-binding protein [[Clostridium] innocuum]MCR0246820.1 DUF87 domain-containing protein [[Clostridium] innocuum]MCR0259895.1 DUF87 domain-containing protein [[Clostridium] innocuum]MCR0391375.1 DUF87 domain-containing protein [[Clostridium] innocuum]
MMDNNQLEKQLNLAEEFINTTYMDSLQEYHIQELENREKKHNLTRLFHITRLVFDKDEDINEKLISVLHSVMPFCKNMVLILKGSANHTDLYIGTRATQISDAAIAGSILHDSFIGNFPGSRINSVSTKAIDHIFLEEGCDDISQSKMNFNIAQVTLLPSQRQQSQTYIQGLEKFIDTMKGHDYICEIIAASVSALEVEKRLNGFEELYTALFPFSKKTASHGRNDGISFTEGMNESITNSISQGISKASGRSDGHSTGKSSGTNMGANILFNFGMMSGTQEGWTTGTNDMQTNSTTTTKSNTYGTQQSTTKSLGSNDNLTIEFRNKNIENLLQKIESHMSRLTSGIAYGMWETAAYFIAEDKKTAAITASTYHSLMLGEETGTQRTSLTLFDSAQNKTASIKEFLRYCEHPRFLIPSISTGRTQISTPTNYVNSKELAVLFNLPRKSVQGVMVHEMAEFGRNVLAFDQKNDVLKMGSIYHMGTVESSHVSLNINSLSSHCFVTGTTGSGKSNTVYRLIEHFIDSDHKIPFLVIEPAKGEYRDQFRLLKNIHLFSTNPLIDQMLKINPFSFCEGIHVLEHLDRLIEIFNTCWEMYAAMPAILKEAMEEAYVSKGWDLLNSIYMEDQPPVFPTFADVLIQLPKIIMQSQYSVDTKGDYTGALVTRVHSMTNGIYGQIFCDDFDIDDSVLFDQNTIIDLSRIGSTETKSLLMGIIILKLNEYRMAKSNKGNRNLQHITVLEEAHNILKNSENMQSSAGTNVIAKSVEMIVNGIAEMRTYGEGFIIVDQSPTSVDIAAIKNTNTKIIMRLPEEQDCGIAGHAVSLSEQQTMQLARLETGVAVMMQNNWEQPVLAKIDAASNIYKKSEDPIEYRQLKSLRSTVLMELIEQYEMKDEQNILKIIESIDHVAIHESKKEEMRRLVRAFDNRMKKGYDSILFGRTMLRLIGCSDVFRKAEQYLTYETKESETALAYTQHSLKQWYSKIDAALPQYIEVTDQHKKIMLQYILYAMRFEQHAINYSLLYQQIY